VKFVSDRFQLELFPLSILGLGFFAFLFHLSMAMSMAAPQAQETATATPTDEESEWSMPVNLSQSGAVQDMTMAIDSVGTVHIVLEEEGLDFFNYVSGNRREWVEPVQTEFPFGTRAYSPDIDDEDPVPLFTPSLIADGNGRIHAFWVNDEEVAFHSSVPEDAFTDFAAWSQPETLAEGVLDLDVAADDAGSLQLAYVRTLDSAEMPAGIYSVHSVLTSTVAASAGWSEPNLISQSSYFRTIEAEDAHVQIASAGSGANNRVFVGWDNRALEKVFLARSTDGGQSWGERQVIDSHNRDDMPEAPGPSGLRLVASTDEVHLIWTGGHDSPLCSLYHQWSSDGGTTWQGSDRILDEYPDCPERSLLLKGLGGLVFLMTTIDTQAYILAWDDGRWSDPQPEAVLTAFPSPETNRRIDYVWDLASLIGEGQLLILGRGGSDVYASTADAWILSRQLGTVSEWFPPPSPWSAPSVVAEFATEPQGLSMVSDEDGQVHALWSQPQSSGAAPTTIYYAARSPVAEDWARPAPVLTSPRGPAEYPAVAASASGKLYATWAGLPGEIYFSQADADNARVLREWSNPVTLPVSHAAVRSAIAVGPAGTIYVAYTVALNEGRGVYVLSSQDEGDTWSEPNQVFDGVNAESAMVSDPQLIVGREGMLHLLWAVYSLPPRAVPQVLFYAQSEDSGGSWSDAREFATETAGWGEVIYDVKGEIVHRLWQIGGEEPEIWHDFSMDGGVSWSPAGSAIIPRDEVLAVTAIGDLTGRVHLLWMDADEVKHSIWEEDGWVAAEVLELDGLQDSRVEWSGLEAVAAPNGRLYLLLNGSRPSLDEGQQEYELIAIERTLSVDETSELATRVSSVSPTQTPTATSTPTPQPTPSPTPEFARTQGSNSSPTLTIPGTDNTIGQIVVSLVPVGLLLVLVTVFVLRVLWYGRR